MSIEERDGGMSGILPGQDKNRLIKGPEYEVPLITGRSLLDDQRDLLPASLYPNLQYNENGRVILTSDLIKDVLATLPDVDISRLPKEILSRLAGL